MVRLSHSQRKMTEAVVSLLKMSNPYFAQYDAIAIKITWQNASESIIEMTNYSYGTV